jgi:hypothetical protein
MLYLLGLFIKRVLGGNDDERDSKGGRPTRSRANTSRRRTTRTGKMLALLGLFH